MGPGILEVAISELYMANKHHNITTSQKWLEALTGPGARLESVHKSIAKSITRKPVKHRGPTSMAKWRLPLSGYQYALYYAEMQGITE